MESVTSRATKEEGADGGGSGGGGREAGGATTAGGVRRMRFAPTVPVERRARQRGAAEDNSEPQLPQHVQRLIKQAQLDGKVVRPREVVQVGRGRVIRPLVTGPLTPPQLCTYKPPAASRKTPSPVFNKHLTDLTIASVSAADHTPPRVRTPLTAPLESTRRVNSNSSANL